MVKKVSVGSGVWCIGMKSQFTSHVILENELSLSHLIKKWVINTTCIIGPLWDSDNPWEILNQTKTYSV